MIFERRDNFDEENHKFDDFTEEILCLISNKIRFRHVELGFNPISASRIMI